MEYIPILEIILFCLGFAALIKGGDWFVDGATGIAKRFRIPELIIGATVVAIGTTLPEVMVSATSAVKGIGSMAYGNSIGSIICNTALIAALTIAIRPAEVEKKALVTPIAFFFGAAAIYCGTAVVSGFFSRTFGVILLLIFAAYLYVTVRRAEKQLDAEDDDIPTDSADDDAKRELLGFRLGPTAYFIVFLVLGAALIALGASLLVDNGTVIAAWLGVPDAVIALTFVALGTSLPELVTAITSLAKGHGALSLGNIIGANLFNLVLVSGISVTLEPFAVPSDRLIGGVNASLAVDMPVMLLSMLLLAVPPLCSGKLRRWQGVILLALYAGFCVFQFL